MEAEKVLAERLSIYKIVTVDCVTLSLYDHAVQAGFPSPASDYIEEEIDLANYLNPKPLSTFVAKAVGESMINAFIPPGAYLIVDKSLKPSNNMIVIAVINGDFTIKRYINNSSGVRLMPANPKFPPIPITPEMDFRVWGVVTKIIIDPIKLGV